MDRREAGMGSIQDFFPGGPGDTGSDKGVDTVRTLKEWADSIEIRLAKMPSDMEKESIDVVLMAACMEFGLIP